MTSRSTLYTVNGQRITDTAINKGLRLSTICGALSMCWITISQGLPMSMLMESLGASGTSIGLVTALQQFAMAFLIPAAIISERLSQRKLFFTITNMIHRSIWFLPALLPLFMPGGKENTAIIILIAIAISSIFAQMATAPWLSWMADLVPEKRRGSFWGRRQSISMVAYLLAMLGAGFGLDYFPDPMVDGNYTGFAVIFTIGATLGCLDILLHTRVPEPRPAPIERQSGLMARLLVFWRMPDFRRVTFAFALWSFSASIPGAFAFVYLKREFDASYSQLTLLTVCSALSIALSGVVWGAIQDRLGARAFGVLMMLLGPLACFAWFLISPNTSLALHDLTAFVPLLGGSLTSMVDSLPALSATTQNLGSFFLPQPIWLCAGINLIFAAFYGGAGLAQFNLTGRLIPKEGRTLGMGLHWTVVGVFSAIGSALGGRMVDYVTTHPLPATWMTVFGQPLGFIHVLYLFHLALAWFVAIPFLLRVTKEPREASVKEAFSRIFARNPLRTMGTVYNMYVAGAPRPSWERAKAVRGLGASLNEMAVSDLIEQLEDPSSSVREEAIFALGRIGNPEAIDALLAKLDDPDSDLAPQIARALRERPSPRSVSTVIRKMKMPEPDRETKSELARTLGAIGDQRAVPLLIDTLKNTKDAKLVSASSDALACMGELAAIYEIIPHMKATRNPVLKRSLAVAVGNLLGAQDDFYVVLHRENKEQGSEPMRMLREIAKRIEVISEKKLTSSGQAMQAKIAAIRQSLEAEDYHEAVSALFDLSLGLAAMLYGVECGEDAKTGIESLIWRDQRFGTGVWFMNLLLDRDGEHPDNAIDNVDVLLALYALHYHMMNLPGN